MAYIREQLDDKKNDAMISRERNEIGGVAVYNWTETPRGVNCHVSSYCQAATGMAVRSTTSWRQNEQAQGAHEEEGRPRIPQQFAGSRLFYKNIGYRVVGKADD